MVQSEKIHKCKIQRISAPMAEEAVLARLEEVILRSGCLAGVYSRLKEYHNEEIGHLQRMKKSLTQNLIKTKDEIEQITVSLTRVTHKTSLDVLEKKLNETLERKESIERGISNTTEEIEELKQMIPDFSSNRELFDTFWKGWKKASLSTKRHFLRNLFEKIVVSERGLEAYFIVFESE